MADLPWDHTVPALDPRTVIVLAGIMGAMMSLVLYFLRRNYPASIQGLAEWATAPFLLFVASLLAGMRGSVPEVLSVVVANLLLFTAVCLFYLGSQRFYRLAPSFRFSLLVVAVAGVVSVWFGLVKPNYSARLMVFAPMLALLFVMLARVLWQQGSKGFSSGFTVVILLCGAAVQLLRFGAELVMPLTDDAMLPLPYHVAYLMVYALVMLLFTICLVLIATDRLREEFEHLATHDSLTDAYTRRHLNEACRQELDRSRRQGRVLSLLMLDIDHFKAINDRFGHQAGDKALVGFVTTVKALLRPSDLLGRFGGEEFVVVLPETGADRAFAIAERIRAATERAPLEPACTVSIGFTTSQAQDDSVDALVARADAAMYQAKAQGRNRVVAADPPSP